MKHWVVGPQAGRGFGECVSGWRRWREERWRDAEGPRALRRFARGHDVLDGGRGS